MAKWVEHHNEHNILVWYVDMSFCKLPFHIMKCNDGSFMITNPTGLATQLVGTFFDTLDDAKNECYDHVRKSANMMNEVLDDEDS